MSTEATTIDRPRVVVVGCFQNGKSTLVNCLLDDRMAQTGSGLSTTHINTLYSYGEFNELALDFGEGAVSRIPLYDKDYFDQVAPLDRFVRWSKANDLRQVRVAKIRAWKPILDSIDLLDTPGFNADDLDDSMARNGLDGADYAIVVVNNKGISQIEKKIIDEIAKRGLSYIIVMNCTDRRKWRPSNEVNRRLAAEIEARLHTLGTKPDKVSENGTDSPYGLVWPCNLLWFWMATGHDESDPDRNADDRMADKEMAMKELKINHLDSENLALESNLIPLRRFLKTYPWRGVTQFESKLTAAIRDAANVWTSGLQEIVQPK